MFSKETELLKYIYNKGFDRIGESSRKINYNDLKFIAYSSGLENNFSGLKNHATFLDDIKTNKILIEEARYN